LSGFSLAAAIHRWPSVSGYRRDATRSAPSTAWSPGVRSGYSSGERAGERIGDANGDLPGDRSVEATGERPGDRNVEATGERPGDRRAEAAGERPGDRNVEATGERPGDRRAEAAGERPGDRNVDRMDDLRADRSDLAKSLTSASSLNWSMAASLNWMSSVLIDHLLCGVPDNSTTGQRVESRRSAARALGHTGDDGCVIEQDWSRIENLWSLVERAARRHGDRPFIESTDGTRTLLTFSQLADGVRAVAGFLKRRGVGEGRCVAVSLHNSPLLQFMFIATMAARRVLVPLNPAMAAGEVAHVLRETEPGMAVVDRRLSRRLAGVLDGVACELVDRDDAFMESLLGESRADADAAFTSASPGDDAEIVFMSGPSGRPKGVVLSHRSLIAGAWGVGEAFGFEPGARFLTVSPLFHTSGQMSTTLAPLWTGGVTTAVRSDQAMLDFWGLVERFRPHWTFVVNSFLALLLERGPTGRPHSLRGVLAGGSRFTSELIEGFESTFGVRVHQCYGLTETAGTSTCEDADPAARSLGSAGRPLPVCSLRIVAEGREAPAGEVGEVGEIEVRGPNLFTRYLGQPDMTAERLRDGWLRTGDAGRIDERGNLFVLGRADRMIIVGGEKLYPVEVERLVPELAGIEEAVVAPVPHPILGAELALVYRLRPGADPDPEGWTEVLARALSAFKVPRRFVAAGELGLSELPRGRDGAVLREEVEEALAHVALADADRADADRADADRAGAPPSPSRGSR
jgi:long-chain acyl-CoA synthetase